MPDHTAHRVFRKRFEIEPDNLLRLNDSLFTLPYFFPMCLLRKLLFLGCIAGITNANTSYCGSEWSHGGHYIKILLYLLSTFKQHLHIICVGGGGFVKNIALVEEGMGG